MAKSNAIMTVDPINRRPDICGMSKGTEIPYCTVRDDLCVGVSVCPFEYVNGEVEDNSHILNAITGIKEQILAIKFDACAKNSESKKAWKMLNAACDNLYRKLM